MAEPPPFADYDICRQISATVLRVELVPAPVFGDIRDLVLVQRKSPRLARPRQSAGEPGSAETGGSQVFAPRTAFELCAGVIAGPLPITTEIPDRDTLITTRWLHLEMHEPMPALPAHTIGTYYGPPSPRVWRRGRMRLAGVGRPGTVTIVPAGWDGDWDIDVASPLSYAMLSDARLQGFAEPFTRGRRVELAPRLGEADPVGAHILRALSREATHPDPSRRLFVEQALDLLCTHLLRIHSTFGQAPVTGPQRGLRPWQIRRVTAYMSERLDQSISLDELARLISLSRSHFCTAFRHATGRTPHEWLTGLRLQQARQLLQDPRIRITDVALAVGYQTPSAFAAAFRRHTGATPSEFRRSL
ncbi:AraC family transcriptional regulator [Inquilinus sp. OTU3971]|uniref:AraC family transcriptional regulator n=1 Tax=Inquilinus sp. OTU3971 TaxID=3043855 RepID=UPI00313D24CA